MTTAKFLATAAVMLAATPAGAQGADPEFGPVDRTGPALTAPAAKLEQSLACTSDIATNPREPVLMTPATTVDSAENYGWNWIPALKAAGFAVCTTDNPDGVQNMGDMQARAEYVTFAIRRVYELAGKRRIAVIGHSQGGMIMRWPLRFWPDTRAMVADVVGMAGTNHGSIMVPGLCVPSCAPALWQQRSDSMWVKALNSGQETFPGVDYTEIYSHADEFVQPNLDDGGTSSLHGPGRIANVALQDLCPLDTSEHLEIGTTDPVAWALGLDAITHDGPADRARIPASVCGEQWMPGVDPVTGPASFAAVGVRVTDQLALAPKTTAEPALRCYTLASGCPNSPPIARAWVRSVAKGRQCRYSARASRDADGTIAAYRWTLGARTVSTHARFTRAQRKRGRCPRLQLTVTDDRGATASAGATRVGG